MILSMFFLLVHSIFFKIVILTKLICFSLLVLDLFFLVFQVKELYDVWFFFKTTKLFNFSCHDRYVVSWQMWFLFLTFLSESNLLLDIPLRNEIHLIRCSKGVYFDLGLRDFYAVCFPFLFLKHRQVGVRTNWVRSLSFAWF